MRRLLFITLLIYTNTTAQIHDFNQDGFMDTVRNGEYIDGKSGDYYSFMGEGNFSDFIEFIAIPKGVEKYPDVMESLGYEATGSNASPPLQWLISAYNTEKDVDNTYYSRVFFPTLTWHNRKPEFPSVMHSLVSLDTARLPSTEDEFMKVPPHSHGWLTYYGHNHRRYVNGTFIHEYETEDEADKFILLSTSHGLLMQTRNKYAWIFHSNGSLTGGPSKLRWSSIDQVHIYQDYVFVHHNAPVLGINRIFVISTISGKVGQLALEAGFTFNSSDCYSVSFEEDQLYITSESGEYCERQEDGEEAISFNLKILSTALEVINP